MPGDLPNFKAIGMAFVVFAAVMLAAIAYPRGDFVLVVGKPGMDEAAMMDMIGGAGGTFVSHGKYGWLAIAHAETSGFAGRLLRSGAVLVLDHALAAGCLERK